MQANGIFVPTRVKKQKRCERCMSSSKNKNKPKKANIIILLSFDRNRTFVIINGVLFLELCYLCFRRIGAFVCNQMFHMGISCSELHKLNMLFYYSLDVAQAFG